MRTANWGGSVPVKVADPMLPSAKECQSMNSLISPTVLDVHTVSEEKGNHSTIESQTENRYCLRCTQTVASGVRVGTKKQRQSSWPNSVVSVKRSKNDFVVRRLCAFLRELGLEHAGLTLRSDRNQRS